MSSRPFNAMWTAPPPPSYIDTVYINPRDYVVLLASGGEEALVHRECLMESPVLRLAFRKRVPVVTDDVVVTFTAEEEGEQPSGGVAASSPHLQSTAALPPTQVTSASPTADADSKKAAAETNDVARPSTAAVVVVDPVEEEEAAAAAAAAAVPEPRYPVTLRETLQTDNTVRVTFPRLDGDQLAVVVSYLYFKHRYSRRPSEERPAFDVPATAALEVMRVAQALEC